ncbi:hypothetical protein EGM_16605, partial [Macaca fascicularis]
VTGWMATLEKPHTLACWRKRSSRTCVEPDRTQDAVQEPRGLPRSHTVLQHRHFVFLPLSRGAHPSVPPRGHFTHSFFTSRVDGTVEPWNPALWLCLSSPTGTRATKDLTLSSVQASQLEEARRQRPRGHQEVFEPAERAW